MSEVMLTNGAEGNLPAQLDIETLKSVYYWLNAKPDTHMKVFGGARLVTYNDLLDINAKIQDKLQIHQLVANITTITVIFEKGEVKSFNAWEVFKNNHWEVPQKTESISINWDISIKLPNYKLPQKHTLKVRIGSSLRPNEVFHLIANGDDEIELRENLSFLVCKVDFINIILSRELINIVEVWYNSLEKLHPQSRIQTFLEKHKSTLSRVGHYMTTTIGLAFLFIAFKIHLKYINLVEFGKEAYLDGMFWAMLMFAIYFVSNIIGASFGSFVFEKIGKYQNPHYFSITKGDKNEQTEINRKNKKISSNLIWHFIIRATVAIISLLVSKFILHN
ncbi:hypothetical protein D3H65_01310 [Paraflavitalea soli]|uniref:Uncharacterized protein n=1 Tax=Paraflavitalea soli TaxID=2315862 RepID=A0A3B7MEI3_9BACT|nr:hypothetical protein [Paraflavitalea soli]AXY72692.1 hypothetical protein D3H65_01310 [Paraflavitalea soli]